VKNKDYKSVNKHFCTIYSKLYYTCKNALKLFHNFPAPSSIIDGNGGKTG